VKSVKRVWKVAEEVSKESLLAYPHLHPIVCQLLQNREIDLELADSFLSPVWENIHDSGLFRYMPEAVGRLFSALKNGETIVVHGDYDADGVCGSALLLSAFKELKNALKSESSLNSYIPHRDKEGYGVSVATIEKLAGSGTRLIVTVDCGISNRPAVERAKELGMDVIICDHHSVPVDPPIQAILIHPGVEGETYPFRHLCGTSVAYKFVSSLISEAREKGLSFPEGYEKWWLDLVAIATVTDVMPLSGENRLLEFFGLKVLNKTRRPGLVALVEAAGANMGAIDTTTVGFQLGPRLNAAGRMTHASYALDLLLSENIEEARTRAALLNDQNQARQSVCEKMYKEAAKELQDFVSSPTMIAIVRDNWSPGLVGLVAGKLTETHALPVVAIGKEGDRYIGSGRSIPGYDITEALKVASAHLDRFGGHPQACGFSAVSREELDLALAKMKQHAEDNLPKGGVVPILEVDAELKFETLTLDFVDRLQSLAPYGSGNPLPIFVSRMLVVRRVDCLGKQKTHLKLALESSRGTILPAIGFRMSDLADSLPVGTLVDVVFEASINVWRDKKEVQLRLIDLEIRK